MVKGYTLYNIQETYRKHTVIQLLISYKMNVEVNNDKGCYTSKMKFTLHNLL